MTIIEPTRTIPDMPAIMDLIAWAERTQSRIDAWKAPSGTWDQGSWAQVSLDAGSDEVRAIEQAAPGAARSDEMSKAMRNGVCETAFCMAGETVWQNEYRIVLDTDSVDAQWGMQRSASQCIKERPTGRKDERGFEIWEIVPGAEEESIYDVGARLLGLDEDEEAGPFFDGDNSVEDLREKANWIAERNNLPLPYPNDPIWHHDDYADEDDQDF